MAKSNVNVKIDSRIKELAVNLLDLMFSTCHRNAPYTVKFLRSHR